MNIKEILEKHTNWLNQIEGGEKADLRGADLRCADLRDADLCDADLRSADLCDADLRGADLRCADLRCADLRGTDLRNADLRDANLCGTDLRGADLMVLLLPIWIVFIHKETVRIGCKHYKHEEWLSFSDNEIDAMDTKALNWWTRHKPLIEVGIQTIKNQQQ